MYDCFTKWKESEASECSDVGEFTAGEVVIAFVWSTGFHLAFPELLRLGTWVTLADGKMQGNVNQ